MNRFLFPFQPIASTGPSFEVAVDSTSVVTALESTAINRIWQGPAGRAVRLSCSTATDFYVTFGSSLSVAASTDSMLMLGGTVEIFKPIRPSDAYIALQSSTDVTVNITLGYGQ